VEFNKKLLPVRDAQVIIKMRKEVQISPCTGPHCEKDLAARKISAVGLQVLFTGRHRLYHTTS